VEQWLKENCILWPNGERTKQIIMQESAVGALDKEAKKIKRRAYLIHNDTIEDGRELRDLTEGELGQYHLTHGYIHLSDQEIRESDKKFKRDGETGCWYCKEPIDLESDTRCPKCNIGIPCSNPKCGKCLCDDPTSKLYERDVRNIHNANQK
jgi:hypothetical protein